MAPLSLILNFVAAALVASSPEPASPFHGTWEGEFLTQRSPTYLSMRLERQADGRIGGSVEVLGQTITLTEVRIENGSVYATFAPELFIEASLRDEVLAGNLTERGARFPLELVRVPEYPRPSDRVESWTQDLEALSTRFLRYDRSFTPAQQARAKELIEAIRLDLPRISDSEVIMRMAAAVSLSRNAHTRLYLLRNRTELRRFPLRLWWFGDGLYVVRAAPEYRALAGCRVDDFDGVSSRHARDRVSAAFAGNASWTDYKSVYFLTSPEALHGSGIAKHPDRVTLGVSGCGAAPRRVTIEPLPLAKSTKAVEAWWDLSPLYPHDAAEWAHALGTSQIRLPLHLRNPDRYYWFEFLTESGILYVHYSRSAEMTDEKTAGFAKRLLAEIDQQPVKALVVDLRFNTGGNLGLGREMMEQLQAKTNGIPRFVITGRATFSAGITHAVTWRSAKDVTFVGEEPGDVLDFLSEGGNVILPNSRLAAHFANAFHSYSPAPCPADIPCFLDLSSPPLRPDLAVTANWADYAAGRDVAMEAIEAALRHR